MRHLHRLPVWQRRTLYGAGAVLLGSGVAWLGLHYGRAGNSLPTPLEAWLMRLHGLAGFAALFCFGVLMAAHIPQGLRLSRRMRWAGQHSSGLLLCGLAGALAVTGYLLYYFAPDVVRPALGWLHSALGVTMAALIISHRRRPRGAGGTPTGGQIARAAGGAGWQDAHRGFE
ncbi:MAG TPA: DUF4405 domain-containing protein [Caldimonas sp.]|jgi:hypothetical protein